jgi:hypothetical protein
MLLSVDPSCSPRQRRLDLAHQRQDWAAVRLLRFQVLAIGIVLAAPGAKDYLARMVDCCAAAAILVADHNSVASIYTGRWHAIADQ